MRVSLFIATVTLIIGVLGSADAKPPDSCDPWPDCKEGDDGSGDDGSGGTSGFSENCKNKNLTQWAITGNWSASGYKQTLWHTSQNVCL